MRFFKLSSVKLTNRELEIMSILWNSEVPLMASEIVKLGNELTINTVQAVLKKLLARNYIEIADIGYSGTVLSRSYKPTLTADEYEMNKMLDSYRRMTDKSNGMSRFVATLLEEEKNTSQLLSEIEELETILKSKKEDLSKKGIKR